MRIEVHVKALEEVDAVKAQFAGSDDEIVIIVGQSSSRPAERQERKQAVGTK